MLLQQTILLGKIITFAKEIKEKALLAQASAEQLEEERAKELGEPVKNNVPVKILKEAKKLAKIASEMESRAVLENRSIKKRYSGMF